MPALDFKSVTDIAQQIRSRVVSSRDIALLALARVQEVEPRLKAFLTVTGDYALQRAEAIHAAIARGEDAGPLAGVPFALKDNMCTKGVRTTCGSRILPNFVPPYSATVFERLEAAGA